MLTANHVTASQQSAKGFDPKLMATLQKMLDPNRFYPDLKNDPDLFIELPEMAGFWAGEVKDGYRSDTTSMNINLISKYKPGYNPAHVVWLCSETFYRWERVVRK